MVGVAGFYRSRCELWLHSELRALLETWLIIRDEEDMISQHPIKENCYAFTYLPPVPLVPGATHSH